MDLTNRLDLVIAGIGLLLTLASAGLMIFRERLPEKEREEIIIRTKSWWVICVLFFGSLLGGVDTTLVLFCLCSYLGFKEFITLVPSRKADRRALFWAYLSIPFQYYWIHTTWYVMFLIFIPVYAFVVIATRLVIAGETERFIRAVSTIQWGLLATTYAVSHLAYMDTFPPQGNGSNGPTMVVFVVLVTELNDNFSSFGGRHSARPGLVRKSALEKHGRASWEASSLPLL